MLYIYASGWFQKLSCHSKLPLHIHHQCWKLGKILTGQTRSEPTFCHFFGYFLSVSFFFWYFLTGKNRKTGANFQHCSEPLFLCLQIDAKRCCNISKFVHLVLIMLVFDSYDQHNECDQTLWHHSIVWHLMKTSKHQNLTRHNHPIAAEFWLPVSVFWFI